MKAISKRLEKFTDLKDVEKFKRLENIKHYLASLANKKLQGLYVDWDAQNNKWFYFKDSNSHGSIKKEVDEAVYHAKSVIKKYLEYVGGEKDLVLTIPSKLIESLQKKKIHAFCPKCSKVMISRNEFGSHSRICGHITQWFWNEK